MLFLFLPIDIMRLTIKINRFIAFILFIVKRNKFYNIPAINRNIYALFCLCLKRRFCVVSEPVLYKLYVAVLQYRFVLAAVTYNVRRSQPLYRFVHSCEPYTTGIFITLYAYRAYVISTHAPARGATKGYQERPSRCLFLLTPPRGGRRYAPFTVRVSILPFLLTPPRGGRPGLIPAICISRIHFYSRPREGGDPNKGW